jgi:hypothetical protein
MNNKTIKVRSGGARGIQQSIYIYNAYIYGEQGWAIYYKDDDTHGTADALAPHPFDAASIVTKRERVELLTGVERWTRERGRGAITRARVGVVLFTTASHETIVT